MAKQTTPAQAIRLHCLKCRNGDRQAVKRCAWTACDLYPHRFGRKPAAKKPRRVNPFRRQREDEEWDEEWSIDT